MPNSYARLLYHCVFGTQDRRGLIHANVARELYPYLVGILPARKGRVLKAGGTTDHVHVLLELSTDTSVAEAMRLVKANSSRWLNERGLCAGPFRWQRGFAAFTVSASATEDVSRYIARQTQHHARRDFTQELQALLEKHGVEFDSRFL